MSEVKQNEVFSYNLAASSLFLLVVCKKINVKRLCGHCTQLEHTSKTGNGVSRKTCEQKKENQFRPVYAY